MAKGTIGAKIVLEGEKAYREAIKAIKTEQAELRSEMKLCSSEFKNSQNSLEALTKKHEILTKQIDAQTRKIETYQNAMEASTDKQEKAAEKIKDLQIALGKAEEEMKAMKDSSDAGAEAIENQQKSIDELKKKLNLAEESYTKAGERASSYRIAVNNATVELNSMQADLDKTTKCMKEAEDSTDKCATSIDEYGKETEDASGKTKIFGEVLKANIASEVIVEGARKLADGIKQIAGAAIETGSSFEEAMTTVAATMGMTAEEVNSGSEDYAKLQKAAEDCGKATKFSATEAGEALNYLALAGYDVNKSVETLPKVLDLAAAGGLDLAYASDLVTDAMAALGMETSDLDKYIDEMAKTSQKSNTNVAQLGEATLVCAGTVSLTQQKLETMNAELGILANNGIKGSEGGTHLRNVLLSLSAPTDNAAVAIDSLGVNIFDASHNMRDLNDILVDMNTAMADMSTEQRTQMISQIFNKTDIAAVNALLKGTGEEFNNLTDQLSNCKGAASEMANTMNNNLKGDVTILQSAMEGLGISVYKVFNPDLRKSVQGATDAVGRLQKAVDSGNLGVSLNKMSKALGDFCEKAVDAGEDALPDLIDGFTWILENGDLVTAGITGIVAANLEMNTVAPAISAAMEAWRAYKTANEGATVSQWLLNTAMDANPVGILITAITGLTAAVAAYMIINKDHIAQQGEETEKTKELIEETRSLNEEYSQNADARRKTKDDLAAQSATAGQLAAELEGLRNKTNLTTAEQNRMKMVVAELNELLPDLNLAYDEQSGIFNKTQEEIEGCVDAYMALYKAQAAQEELQNIAKQQVEYEKQLYDIGQQRKELQEELSKAQEEYNAIIAEYGDEIEAHGAFAGNVGFAQYEQLQAAKDAMEELNATQKETQENNEALAGEYEYWMEVIGDNQPIYDAAAAEGTLGEEAQAAALATLDMADTVSQAFQDMYSSVSETVQDQLSLFSEFSGKAELSTTELLNNMQSQVDGISKWADNLEALAERGIDQGLLQKLANMGPEGAGYVATFVDMTDEELQRANELFEDSLTLSDDVATQIAEAYEEAGKNAAAGFQTGMEDSKEDVQATAEEVAQGTLDKTREVLDINSPSGEFKEIGKLSDDGLIEGLKENKNDVELAVESVCSAALTAGKNGIVKTDWSAIGKRIPEGLAEGIKSGNNLVTSAIDDMVSKALEKAREGLDIHSPSKKFDYMGEMSGTGYINGWVRSMSGIDNIIERSLPDLTKIGESNQMKSGGFAEEYGKQNNVNQVINIYALEDSPADAAKKFRDAQEEAAEAW